MKRKIIIYTQRNKSESEKHRIKLTIYKRMIYLYEICIEKW